MYVVYRIVYAYTRIGYPNISMALSHGVMITHVCLLTGFPSRTACHVAHSFPQYQLMSEGYATAPRIVQHTFFAYLTASAALGLAFRGLGTTSRLSRFIVMRRSW
jgi:hypothetical protein